MKKHRNKSWTRKHDEPGVPFIQEAPVICYPNSLEDLIDICRERKQHEFLKASGGHWALSEVAVSDHTFIETHDPKEEHTAMGRTLYDVVPPCLSTDLIKHLTKQVVSPFSNDEVNIAEDEVYLVHFETGKKIYQLYSELDYGDDDNNKSLAYLLSKEPYNNTSYLGAWALQTMGNAGGQTVFGALTTGTHGGDIHLPPLADAVEAMHLVADGGKHYWIERSPLIGSHPGIRLTDDAKLTALYGDAKYGGIANFEIIRDNNIFDAVLVSAGRFGIVYSIVIRVIRQFCLHEQRRLEYTPDKLIPFKVKLHTWQNIRDLINDPQSWLYNSRDEFPASSSDKIRFLRIGISVTPLNNLHENLCSITKSWKVPARPNPENPNGRKERRGDITIPYDDGINGPRFKWAGTSSGYNPDPNKPNQAKPTSFLERACSYDNFLEGVLEEVYDDIYDFVHNN